MKIVHIVGARPNFMKVAPVMRALAMCDNVTQKLVHTGQHYDAKMSDIFFQQLGLPEPDINLEVGSGSHAAQTAAVMVRFEEVMLADPPDLVLVYGDVNSTMAAALVCAKLQIRVGHVEAGLRSRDRTMPEEINRLVTDQIADLLFTPSADGNDNLLHEGVSPEKIFLVGNVMIDTLVRLLPEAMNDWPKLRTGLKLDRFALVTLHRPSNVDDPAMLTEILKTLDDLGRYLTILFPIHPRTRRQIEIHGLERYTANVRLEEPLGYLDFLALQAHAAFVITDSGGVQEETTYLQVPCLTVRANTERPVTVMMGTNTLVGQDMARLHSEAKAILAGNTKLGKLPPLWEGNAGKRIAEIAVSLV